MPAEPAAGPESAAMNLSPFVITLLAVTLPILALLVAAAWLSARGIGRVRFVSRDGRPLAEVVFAGPARRGSGAENGPAAAFRP
jgi:hypothetical protein